jgi:predicted histone-like DNA-binding protein
MPIVLNKIERINPVTKTKKWYVTTKTLAQAKENAVARQIADETTLNRKEAEMSLSQLEKVVITNLLSSKSVQLGDWGSFHLTCNSDGKDTKEELTARAVKGLNIRFKPGKALKEALKNASFVFADSLTSK